MTSLLEQPDLNLDSQHLPAPLSRRAELAVWLNDQPLVLPAVALVAGIWLDAAWAVPGWLSILLFLVGGGLLPAVRRRPWLLYAVLPLAAFSTGAAVHDLHFRRQPANHVAHYCARESLRVRMTGTVLAPPQIRSASTGRITWFKELPRTRLLVDAEQLEGRSGPLAVCGTVAVHVRQPVLHVTAGDRVEIVGTLFQPPLPDNPGEKDWRLILRRKGILAELSCERAADLVVEGVSDPGRRWIAGLRRRLKAAMIDQAMPGDMPGANMLAALVLGQRSAVDDRLNQAFVNTGTVHYLSVSGAHVAMLASVVWLIGTLAGVSRRACALWAMILIIMYALLTEPEPPVVRSALMGSLLCISVLLRRPARSANWLALSAIILLIIEPMQLFDPGFQLSYVTVLALMFVGPRLHAVSTLALRRMLGRDDPLLSPAIQKKLNPPSPPRMILDWFLKALGWSLAISVAAWAVGTVLGVYHFRQIAMWGWLNTILIIPLVWFVLLLGLLKTLASTGIPSGGGLLGKPLAWFSDRLIRLVDQLQILPGSGTITPAIPLWLTAMTLGLIGLWTVWPWLRLRRRWLIAVAMIVAAAWIWHLSPSPRRGTLTLTFPSITNGNCCLISFPNGQTWVYDVGSLAGYDIQRWVVGPLLADKRVSSIDALVLSHANLDHFSGVPDLIDHHNVRRLLISPWFFDFSTPGDAPDRLLAYLRKQRIAVTSIGRGSTLPDTGDVTVEVLWPPLTGGLPIRNANDSSLVIRIGYAGYRILLCGDIMEQGQSYLIERSGLSADVLVLPHHGSTTADPRRFILAVNPRYCIRCGGPRNTDIPNRLADVLADRVYLDCQTDGTIEVKVHKSGLFVTPWRQSPIAR